MFKATMASFAAIGVYAAATERGMNPFGAIAVSVGMACVSMYVYCWIERMDKEHEERKKCQRRRVQRATGYGEYRPKRTSNRDTYARYATANTAEKANTSNIVVVAGKGNIGSSTVSKKPIRKVCGALSYDYYRENKE